MKAHDHLLEVHETIKAFQLNDPLKECQEAMRSVQFHDPMKEIRETIKAAQLYDPLKEHQEAMRAVQRHDPMKEIREAIKAAQLYDPLKEYREAIRAVQLRDPMEEIREAIKAAQLYDPWKEHREAMKAIQLHDPLKDVREAMKALLLQNSLNEYRAAIKASQFNSSMQDAHNAFKNLNLENIFRAISPQEWPLAHTPFDGGITVNADNTITLDSTTISCSEIQQIADEIADRVFKQSSEQIEYVISNLVAEIRGSKNPAIERILSMLIYPIIVGLIFSIVNPITDFYIKESLSAEKREVEKRIKKHVLAATKDSATLDSYRLVSGKSLSVRANPSAMSPALGCLHFGQVVMLIEKRKDWSLIAWSDDDNEVALQGWVFSRYLGKFR